jgi:hypothetical protein
MLVRLLNKRTKQFAIYEAPFSMLITLPDGKYLPPAPRVIQRFVKAWRDDDPVTIEIYAPEKNDTETETGKTREE